MNERNYEINKDDAQRTGVPRSILIGIGGGIAMIALGGLLSATVILLIVGVPLIIAGVFFPFIAPFFLANNFTVDCGGCNRRITLIKSRKYVGVCRSCSGINRLSSTH